MTEQWRAPFAVNEALHVVISWQQHLLSTCAHAAASISAAVCVPSMSQHTKESLLASCTVWQQHLQLIILFVHKQPAGLNPACAMMGLHARGRVEGCACAMADAPSPAWLIGCAACSCCVIEEHFICALLTGSVRCSWSTHGQKAAG